MIRSFDHAILRFIYFDIPTMSVNGILTHYNIISSSLHIYFTGLLAKKAVEAGLTVNPYIKTSLSPGSGVVTYYLKESGVIDYLEKLG